MSLGGASASAETNSKTAAEQLRHSTDVVRFFENHSWMVASRKTKCWEVPWQRTCTIARRLVKKHEGIIRTNFFTILDTDNWTRAIRYAQKPFPNTDEWLFRISGRECRACYTVPGAFVCNYQGSGACGPMQFMSGTFYGHMMAAKNFLIKKGFRVPERVWNWRHPLGQALVAGYMRYTGIDNCHWCQTDY